MFLDNPEMIFSRQSDDDVVLGSKLMKAES